MTADENPLGGVVAKALADAAFKQQLIADPAAVLAAEGVSVPEGVTLKVVADTDTERTLVIPALPGRLLDAELEYLGVSAGDCGNDCGGRTDHATCLLVGTAN